MTRYLHTNHGEFLKDPFEHYSAEAAKESYRRLSAKYPKNPFAIKSDLETAARVRRERRKGWIYGHD